MPKYSKSLQAWSGWLRRHSVVLWLLLALFAAAAGSGLRYLDIGVDTAGFLLQRDAQALAEFRHKYQVGQSIGIYTKSLTGPLQPAQLDPLSQLSGELKELSQVRSVRSLADLWQKSRGNSAGEKLKNFRRSVARFPELAALHSQDWRALWLLIDTKKPGAADQALARQLEQLLKHYETPGKLSFIPVGIPINSYRLEKELSADLSQVLSIAALLCLLCIFLLLQNRMAVILCVLGNVLLVFGLSGWLGLRSDKTFVMIPVLLGFASSISYCVHIERTWIALSTEWQNNRLYETLRRNFRPLGFAALTTVLSLLSFIAVPIPMIRTVGLQSALAVSLSWFLAQSLFCSLLCTRPKTKAKTQTVYAPVLLMALACYRQHRWTILVAGILLLGSLLLLPRLKVDIATEAVLGRKFLYVRELMEVSRSEIGAGGFYNIDLGFREQPLGKEHLQQLGQFEQELRQTSLVKNVTSVASFIRSAQRIYRGHSEFPDSARESQQALLIWERLFGTQRSQWYSPEAKSLRIMVQVRQGSSQENLAHLREVSDLAARTFAPNITVQPLGGIFQLALMNQRIN